MSKVLLRVGVMAALTMLPAFGAEVNRSWETLVETLKPGRRVVVVQHSRKQAEGELLSLTGESITVQMRGQALQVPRDDVFRVRIADIRQKRTLIGLGIGAAVGVISGLNLGTKSHGTSAVVFGGLVGGIGAAAGGAIPIGKPLYEAPGGLKKSGT